MAENKEKKADVAAQKRTSKKSEARYRSMAEIRKTFYPKAQPMEERRTKHGDARIA